ncbi:MAG: ABC transporter permease [Deltaproteobacteria bacterium]|jgi:peptide/nickel transport system permease protein|nr:ABC transporter permease [Deltaproteobacteria bacterium]MBT4266832.1 ABC transporter permease [Deltaproteobacteria bacterium]MBT4640853.1 ABC transporter permease [Deltaproteobacteria bacterium]MBT6502374.1 ABC transporter permease [Deltaproteobacteria bacterium]MBT7155873.1 ABC transporter permease [Deltaproteobacteria bacterium]
MPTHYFSIVYRVIISVFALLVVSLLLFLLMRDPEQVSVISQVVLGDGASPADYLEWEKARGLHDPVLVQYWDWFTDLLRWNLGESYITGIALEETIGETFPVTFELVSLSLGLALVIGLPLGVLSALNHGRWIDHLTRVVSVLGVAVPIFWTGLLLILFFAVKLSWFPPGGFIPLSAGLIPHLSSVALPVFVMGFYYVAILSRLTRSSMLDELSKDYVRTAHAMGLSRPLVWLYALKNALAPVVNVTAMSFGFCFAHALFIEEIFAIPGLSRALLNAIFARDFPVMTLAVLVIGVVFIIANLAADLLNQALNPKLESN